MLVSLKLSYVLFVSPAFLASSFSFWNALIFSAVQSSESLNEKTINKKWIYLRHVEMLIWFNLLWILSQVNVRKSLQDRKSRKITAEPQKLNFDLRTVALLCFLSMGKQGYWLSKNQLIIVAVLLFYGTTSLHWGS